MSKNKVKVSYANVPDGPKSVHIEKLKNGFLIRSCGMNGEDSQFVKDLSKAPTIMARILGVSGKKSAAEIDEMIEDED